MAEVTEAGGLTPDEEKYFAQRGEIDPPGVDESAAEAPEEEAATHSQLDPILPVEPAADAKPEVKEPEAKSTVPLAALLEERRSAREREQRMEERFQQLVEKFAPKPEMPKAPTIEESPVEVLRQVVERQQRNDAQTLAQTQENNLVEAYRAHANKFAETKPDFHEAYQYWQQSIAGELADAMGYVDPAVIEQQVRQFEKNIALQAFQQGANPGERLYKAAMRRGYSVKAADAVTPVAVTTERQIETIRNGAAAGKSLAGAGAGPSTSTIGMRELADMPMEDFLEISEKMFRRANGV